MIDKQKRSNARSAKRITLHACFLTIGLILFTGCGSYGEVSERAYEIATATYGACLAKDENRLAKIEELLNDQEFASDLSAEESDWILQMVTTARSGDWESAAKSAKQMMLDQVQF